jgi:hypothetical protein
VAKIRRMDRTAGSTPRGKNPTDRSEGRECATWRPSDVESEGGESATWQESDDWIGGRGICHVAQIRGLDRRAENPPCGENPTIGSEGKESATWRASDD